MGSRLEQRAREALFWELLGRGMSRPAALRFTWKEKVKW